ncbi:MAG: inositol monophosphatase family protein [Candidatus Firestonebacteria bacterium]
MLKTAILAAEKAAYIQKENYRNLKKVMYKGAKNNLVTKVDLESERVIISTINRAYSSHGFIAEEKGTRNQNSEYCWVIDPLDGTVNYAHGFPMFCVSIALQKNKETVLGVVYAAVFNKLFTAEKDKGARLNGREMKVSQTPELETALLATGFPYSVQKAPGCNFKHFESFCRKAQAVRRSGSAALDLCYVGCGVFDGFFEQNLQPWDTAAAVLFIEEAGGKVTDYKGVTFNIFKNRITASNGKIHGEMLKILKPK